MVNKIILSEYSSAPPSQEGRVNTGEGDQMNTQALCPLCGEGQVADQVEAMEAEYKGHRTQLPQHFLLCNHCGSDFAGAAQAKLNKRALMAWRKQVDGLLTGAEVAAVREQFHLTQAQAARLFGGGPVAFSKYENDDVAQSDAMDTLLRVVRRSPEAFRVLAEEKGMATELAPATTRYPLPNPPPAAVLHEPPAASALGHQPGFLSP
jgi:HTH-type transcriptional regulator/antitoxin MqsA